jgi:HPt (histidine-containing phosphotransfer) domain-containing protein
MEKDYNLEKFKAVCNGNTDVCNKLVAVFIENATNHIEKMRQLVSANDRQGIAEIAHRLIAGLGYVGASRLQKLARDIEKDMPATDMEHFVQKVDCLCNGISSLIQELKREI